MKKIYTKYITSTNGNLSTTVTFLADSPCIDSCLNLSTTATFFSPLAEEVRFNFVLFHNILLSFPVHDSQRKNGASNGDKNTTSGDSKTCIYLTIIPRARTGSELIPHEAEGRMGYWLRGHEGERKNCFSKIQLVGQKYRDKTNFASKTRFRRQGIQEEITWTAAKQSFLKKPSLLLSKPTLKFVTVHEKSLWSLSVWLVPKGGTENEHGERGNLKWEQNRGLKRTYW